MVGNGHFPVERHGAVAVVRISRPDKLNAFFGKMRDEAAEVFEELGEDTSVRAVVVTGAGRAFCAGADVGYLAMLLEERRYDEADELVTAGRRVVTAIRNMPKAVIAAINGAAAGGGANLALACDLRLASDSASIGQTFNRIGVNPDWGGTYAVPRLVGPARAAELFMFADMVPAREAGRIGLVNRVVAPEELMPLAMEWAQTLAAKPALPIRLSKEAIARSLTSTLEEMLQFEEAAQRECFESADAREGTLAFTEKRAPRFGRGAGQGDP